MKTYHKFIQNSNNPEYFTYTESKEFKAGRIPTDNDTTKYYSGSLPKEKSGHIICLVNGKPVNIIGNRIAYHKNMAGQIKLGIGEDVPDYATTVPPLETNDRQIFDGDKWVIDIDSIRAEQKAKINLAVKEQIESGFDSSLGDSFDTTIVDQLNVLGCAFAGKPYKGVSTEAVKVAVNEFIHYKESILGKGRVLKDEIDKATTPEEVRNVSYSFKQF